MDVFKDFIDFIILLQKYEVDYLIVGGYAVGLHSRPRATEDIDFWIRPSKENAENVIKALKEFGFTDLNLNVDEFLDEDQMFVLGRPPFRIDLLTSISGVQFDEAFKNKYVHDLGSIKNVYFISLDDLINNKKASNRKKDKDDLSWIKTYGKNN